MPKSEAPAGQLECLHGVAAFVDHLLQAHPLSIPAPDSSAVLDKTKPIWKTPTACDWETIQSAASKALATAVWLASAANRLQARQDPEHRRLCIRLKEQLYALVYRLISGHLLDPQLDMASLAGYAVGLLTEWQPESSLPSLTLLFQCDALNNLNTLLLRRMATDKALLGTHMDGDGTVAMLSCISTAMTCIDFCEFSWAHAWPATYHVVCFVWCYGALCEGGVCLCFYRHEKQSCRLHLCRNTSSMSCIMQSFAAVCPVTESAVRHAPVLINSLTVKWMCRLPIDHTIRQPLTPSCQHVC